MPNPNTASLSTERVVLKKVSSSGVNLRVYFSSCNGATVLNSTALPSNENGEIVKQKNANGIRWRYVEPADATLPPEGVWKTKALPP